MLLDQINILDAGLITYKPAPKKEIQTISPTWAPEKGALCFVKSFKFLKDLESFSEKSSLVLIIDPSIKEKLKDRINEFDGVYGSDKIDELMCELSKIFFDKKYGQINYLLDARQLNTAQIDPTAQIAQNVFIGDGAIIEEGVRIHSGSRIQAFSHIKKNTEIFSNVVIYPYVQIGENNRIHANSTIGADGFGYQFINGEHKKIWHFGSVIIEDDVEIGANCCIDSGTFTATRVGSGSRIDNLVQIAHNVQIGKKVILCGKVGIAGSAKLDDFCVLGGGVGIAPGVNLGVGVQVAGGSMVNKSWPANSKIGGYPAIPMKEWLRSVALFKNKAK